MKFMYLLSLTDFNLSGSMLTVVRAEHVKAVRYLDTATRKHPR